MNKKEQNHGFDPVMAEMCKNMGVSYTCDDMKMGAPAEKYPWDVIIERVSDAEDSDDLIYK